MGFFNIVTIFWILSEILLSIFMRTKESKENLDRSSLKILWITIIVSTVVGINLSSPRIIITNEYYSQIYHSAIILILLGMVLKLAAILTLRKFYSAVISISENHRLVQSGLYRYIRHPAYSGSLLSFLGLGLVFNNWITLIIIFVPITISFLYRIKIEEEVMINKFDEEYTEYMKNSWKLIPGIY